MDTNQKDIILHYIQGDYTKSEAEYFFKALREGTVDSDLMNEMAEKVWQDSQSSGSYTLDENRRYQQEAYRLLENRGVSKSRFHISYRWVTSVAAILIILLAIPLLLNRPFLSSATDELLSMTTSYGETKEIELPDGTSVMLNSCTTIEYPKQFSGDTREVTIKGEGFFHVKPNKEKPFIIQTDRFRVRVLGTVFNVKNYAYDETLEVDVESGKVQVDFQDAMLRLRANERIRIERSTGDFMKEKDIHEVAPWRNGSFYFNNMLIQDVAKDLERKYGCRIYFEEGQTFVNRITGKHEIGSLDQVLQSVCFVTGLKYHRNGNMITLYK